MKKHGFNRYNFFFLIKRQAKTSFQVIWRAHKFKRFYQMSRPKRKGAFEHAQNEQIQIILRMRKVSAGRLLSINIWRIDNLADFRFPKTKSVISDSVLCLRYAGYTR